MFTMLWFLLLASGKSVPSGRGRGRPSKLTAVLEERIVDLVRDGVALEVAACAEGIHRSTLFEWLRRGREASRLWECGERVPDAEKPFLAFSDAVARAGAEAEIRAVQVVRKSSLDNPRDAQWLLERRHPERWAKPPTALPAAQPRDDGNVVSIDQVRADLQRLHPNERAQLLWEGLGATSDEDNIGDELAIGRQLRQDAQHRLALNAAAEEHDDAPVADDATAAPNDMVTPERVELAE